MNVLGSSAAVLAINALRCGKAAHSKQVLRIGPLQEGLREGFGAVCHRPGYKRPASWQNECQRNIMNSQPSALKLRASRGRLPQSRQSAPCIAAVLTSRRPADYAIPCQHGPVSLGMPAAVVTVGTPNPYSRHLSRVRRSVADVQLSQMRGWSRTAAIRGARTDDNSVTACKAIPISQTLPEAAGTAAIAVLMCPTHNQIDIVNCFHDQRKLQQSASGALPTTILEPVGVAAFLVLHALTALHFWSTSSPLFPWRLRGVTTTDLSRSAPRRLPFSIT